jgi:hypothetical protein
MGRRILWKHTGSSRQKITAQGSEVDVMQYKEEIKRIQALVIVVGKNTNCIVGDRNLRFISHNLKVAGSNPAPATKIPFNIDEIGSLYAGPFVFLASFVF